MLSFGKPRPIKVVERFVAAVNARDLKGIEALAADDMRYVDSAGGYFQGRDTVVEATRRFFEIERDYTFRDLEISMDDKDVLLRGRVTASDERLTHDTLWRARTAGDKIVHWQSYGEDSPALARILAPEKARICTPA